MVNDSDRVYGKQFQSDFKEITIKKKNWKETFTHYLTALQLETTRATFSSSGSNMFSTWLLHDF